MKEKVPALRDSSSIVKPKAFFRRRLTLSRCFSNSVGSELNADKAKKVPNQLKVTFKSLNINLPFGCGSSGG